MKKRLALLLTLILAMSCLASCQYRGKEITSIEYVTIDYNGGYTERRIMDFSSGEVLEKTGIPGWNMDEDYKVIYTFDTALSGEIVDSLYSTGVLNLRKNYTTLAHIIDGGGWSFIIKYSDGSEKVSRGSNAGPYQTFRNADSAVYKITGEHFFIR